MDLVFGMVCGIFVSGLAIFIIGDYEGVVHSRVIAQNGFCVSSSKSRVQFKKCYELVEKEVEVETPKKR